MRFSNLLIGTGSYLPENAVSNDDLSKIMDTSDEWIQKRTGIKFRHIVGRDELTSDLAYLASKSALSAANIVENEIDLIILATSTPDLTFPSTATILQGKLGIEKAVAFDVSAACSGFIYAFSIANAMLNSGQYKTALVVGAETFSKLINYEDRSTAVLFGDGAGAVILRRQDDSTSDYYEHIESDGNFGDILKTNGGIATTKTAGTIEMNGREVFRHGVEKMSEIITEAASVIGAPDWIITHQANMRMISAISDATHLDISKFLVTISNHANTSAASIPLALDHFIKNNTIKRGHKLILTCVGAGLTWGGVGFNY